MAMTLPDGEPEAGPWRAVDVADLRGRILDRAGRPAARPSVVAIDGRSAAGKSSLARSLHRATVRSAIVHTDDVAWHEPFFAWGPLLRAGVLEPLKRGEPVRFRPPAWDLHGRDGLIDVPAGLDLVLIEGVGAAQGAVADLLDATVWVQADQTLAERRGIARDVAEGVNGDPEETVAFWQEWMSHEIPFLATDRPWERAQLVVAGTPTIDLRAGQVAVALPQR